jgi:hypothetical protein
MDGYRRRGLLLAMLGCVGICGVGCQFSALRGMFRSEPRVLPAQPTIEQVIEVVNRNNGAITEFATTNARLSGPGFPTLRANLAFQRDRRFRLRADFMNSPELDVGSNDELFWFWVKRAQPPGVFYCRHADLATTQFRQAIPVDPEMLAEAFGTGTFDPALPQEGPIQLPNDRLEVRTIRYTPQGPSVKRTILDAGRGWILEQHLYDAQNRLVASSFASGHRRDPATNLVMPQKVKIACQMPGTTEGFSVQIDLGTVAVNRLQGDPQQLWAMPTYQGSPTVDLCSPTGQPMFPAASTRTPTGQPLTVIPAKAGIPSITRP